MTAYYNEFDPQAAAWLRELIKQGHIAPGDVDERSIEDVKPGDLAGYRQCHFFAGIGGWSLALRLAGWPDDQPVWTGSCPCQPFSAAGKGAGFDDQRHLWPAWFHLIRECRPAAIFGEQVASKAADSWIDLVHADMEGVGYAFGCVPFPSASIGAPHIRDRNYWLAYDRCAGLRERERVGGFPGGTFGADAREAAERNGVCAAVGMADTSNQRRDGEPIRIREGRASTDVPKAERSGRAVLAAGHAADPRDVGPLHATASTGPLHGFWGNADWLLCRDGKWRPVEPGTFPLAHGLPARVVRLRGYGNAINPWQTAEFIQAYVEARQRVTLQEAA